MRQGPESSQRYMAKLDNKMNLDSLNEQQREAVLATEGPILIIAGAGSGKTRVLTHRIALLLEKGTDPHEILALTFTKKAAGEMRERIRAMVGKQASGLVMGTFHSVFVRFLREYHAYINFPDNFTIFDADDAENCLKTCIMEVLFGSSWNNKEETRNLSEDQKKERKRLLQVYKTKEIASRISILKNEYIVPNNYISDPSLQQQDKKKGYVQLGAIYEMYMKRCKRANAMDFDDILVYIYYLLDRHVEVAKTIARRFRYILVDEYQDTNTIQYDIIRTLSLGHGNICAVGDDSQSIYAFRGAKIDNILNFRRDYPSFRSFKLETNYRSTPEIVDAANRLIEKNDRRIPKVCTAYRKAGLPIDIKYLKNDREEARFIANLIRLRHNAGDCEYSDNAVLYRTNAQARAIEEAMLQAHIPYVIYSGLSFYERQEIKDVLAYIRLVVNRDDDEAFKRICNRPSRGISDATLAALMAAAAKDGRSIFATALEVQETLPQLKPTAVNAVDRFVKEINELAMETKPLDAYEAVKIMLEKSGLYEYYSKEKDDDGRKRTNNINELVNGVLYYVKDQRSGNTDDLPDESLPAYLENIALLSAVDQHADGNDDRVALMTSHCSKGLEFPTVFIAGCEEGLYPSLRTDSGQAQLEEERRLFYVSVTRAMNELILTCCGQRWQYGETSECEPSRFIDEMFPEEKQDN